jgi:hypothetical protein
MQIKEFHQDGPIPIPVLDWAEAIAGVRFTNDGKLEVVPAAERDRAFTAAKTLRHHRWSKLITWLGSEGVHTPVHPFSPTTLRQIAERERDFRTQASVESALRTDPALPFARTVWAAKIELALAKYEVEDPYLAARVERLRWYDRKLVGDDAFLQQQLADVLTQLDDERLMSENKIRYHTDLSQHGIFSEIDAALSTLPVKRQLDNCSISVEIFAGTVTLKGTVQETAEAELVERLVRSVTGVQKVDNQLVTSPSTTSGTDKD